MLLHFPANFYIFKLSLSKSLCSAAFEWIIVLLLWSVCLEEWIQSVFWYSKVHFGIYYTQNCRSSEGRYLNRKYSSIISVGQLVSVHMNIQFIWCFFILLYLILLSHLFCFIVFWDFIFSLHSLSFLGILSFYWATLLISIFCYDPCYWAGFLQYSASVFYFILLWFPFVLLVLDFQNLWVLSTKTTH